LTLQDTKLDALSEDELIRLAYAVTLEPERYGELMQAWSDSFEHISEGAVKDVNRHFDRALSIMDRLGRGEPSIAKSPQELVAEIARPALLVDPDGAVLASNPALDAFCPERPNDVSDLHISSNNSAELRELLTNLEIAKLNCALMVLRLYHDADDTALIMAVTAVTLPDGRRAAQVTSLDLAYREQVGALVGETFGLTKSEIAVAQGIVDGYSTNEIAERRGRSLETIRSQVKSVLQKADLRSQTELIRVFAGLGELVDARDDAQTSARVPEIIIRDDGRKLAFESFGPASGRPVLMMHGMLDGFPVGPRILRLLKARNIRIVGVWRPAFHLSDPDGPITNAAERFTEDVGAVMDQLEIERAPVLGHLGGSLYAFATAAQLGTRISGVVTVGVIDQALIRPQPRRQRIIGLTAKYFPATLPLLLRAGIGDFDADGGKRFIGDLYNSLPFDRDVLEANGHFELYRDELEKGLSQGFRGFQIDAAMIVRDWAGWLEKIDHPVDLIHGAHDRVVQIEAVRAFAKTLPRGELTEISDLGQLVLYARPKLVVDAIERHLA